MCRHYNVMLLSRRGPHARSKGGWPSLSDCEVDPAPANSQSRLLIAQLMAPLGLHAGDEYDAKEFWPRRLRKLLPNLFLSSHLKPSLWSVSARGSLCGQALLSGEEGRPGLGFDPTPWTWSTCRHQPSAWYLCVQADSARCGRMPPWPLEAVFEVRASQALLALPYSTIN